MKKYILPIMINDVLYKNAEILVHDLGVLTTIGFEYNNIKIQRQGEKPFFVLQEIRKHLDSLNIKIACKGSLLNVYPSGMSSVGFKAYELQMGKSGIDLVNIFEETNQIELLSTVEDQMQFFSNWVKSFM